MFVCLLIVLGLPAASGQTRLTRQEEIDAVDRQIKYTLSALQKRDSGDYYLTLAIFDADGLTVAGSDWDEALRRMRRADPRMPMIAVPISKEALIDEIARRVFLGEITAERGSQIAARLRSASDILADGLKEQLRGLRLLRQRLIDRSQSRRETKPTTPTTPRSTGYWRLRDGYPKFKQKEQCATLIQSNTKTDLQAGSSSITIDYADLHGSTKQVTHAFNIEVTFDGLGKTTYDPGEESTFVLEGTWSWTKDGGGYTAAYPVLGYSGGVSIVKAEPRHGNTSAAGSAQLWIGRSSSSFTATDKRTITFKVPTTGKEFTLDMGVGSYGGAGLVTWAYEWVPTQAGTPAEGCDRTPQAAAGYEETLAMRCLASPAVAAVWWALNLLVLSPWYASAGEFVSRRTTLLQAGVDAAGAITMYGVGAALLVRRHGETGEPDGCAALALWVVMLLAEVALRYLGASLSEGGDPTYRLASASPLGRVGYSAWPLLGALGGAAFGHLAARRR